MTPTPNPILPADARLEKVLVVRLSALGDILFTLPAVEAIRRARPEARVDWLVEDRNAGILDLAPGLGERLLYPRSRLSRSLRNPLRWPALLGELVHHVQRLRRTRYDLVLDFQGNLKSGGNVLLTRGVSAGFGPGHNKECNHWFHRHDVRPGPEVVHRVDKALSLARAAVPGIEAEAPRPGLEIPEIHQSFARKELDKLRPGSEVPWVVLHPGTSAFGAFKRWSPLRFAHLGDQLIQRGFEVLVTFGPGEEELARTVVDGMKSGRGCLAPRTGSLGDLAALLSRARLMVGSDSAPLHLAAFLETPVVALFGPKDPAVYRPRFAPTRVVRTYLPCSPCARRTCPDVLCMAEIRVGQVLDAALELLGAPPRQDVPPTSSN